MTKKAMTTDDRPTWDETWLGVAALVAKRSRCSRAQMGAVIVSSDQHIVATGYNGPAANWPKQGQCINWCERAQGVTSLGTEYTGCPAIHAEANALLYVDRSKSLGGTMYIVSPPCDACAKLISNSGITRVVCMISEADMHRDPYKVLDYLKTCGVEVVVVEGGSDNGN
jgi:dCMP deaminase